MFVLCSEELWMVGVNVAITSGNMTGMLVNSGNVLCVVCYHPTLVRFRHLLIKLSRLVNMAIKSRNITQNIK